MTPPPLLLTLSLSVGHYLVTSINEVHLVGLMPYTFLNCTFLGVDVLPMSVLHSSTWHCFGRCRYALVLAVVFVVVVVFVVGVFVVVVYSFFFLIRR